MFTPSHPKRTRKEVRLGKNPDVVYCEDDRIGQGQFGTVYRGRCPATDTFVAVKLLRDIPSAVTSEVASPRHPDRASDSEADQKKGTTTPAKRRLRFPSEVELLWALRSDHCPNIVHVLSVWNKPRKHHATGGATTTATEKKSDAAEGPEAVASPTAAQASSHRTVGSQDRYSDVYVLVTEYCEGGDLQHRLQSLDSAVPTHVARSFTYQLCNALYTLKRRRIVHRDIKPANLLLSSRDWEKATLKVADFGMAKAAPVLKTVRKTEGTTAAGEGNGAATELIHDDDDDEPNFVSSTLFYSEVGTPMYMSPERIAGQPYDYKADVYSAGMVLLELLRGSCVRVTRVSQLRTMVPETIQRIRLRYAAKNVEPPAWLDLVQRMTAIDPAQRYSVEEVLQHPWFNEKVGRPLPPLTFELPPKAKQKVGDAGKEPEKNEENVKSAAAQVSGDTATASCSPSDLDGGAGVNDVANPLKSSSTDASPTLSAKDTARDATETIPPSPQTEGLTAGVEEEEAEKEFGTAAPAGGRRRQKPPSHWSLLGVCTGIELQHNTAHCIYAGPTAKPQHNGPVTTNSKATAASEGLSLPASCGPHVITHAVRGFVDSVYLYVLQDELDAVRGLTLVSFLVELVQNGFGAYLECLESLGGGGVGANANSIPTADPHLIGENNSSNNGCGGVCINGHRFVVKDVGGLPEVWQQLMVRLSHVKTMYTAQLPPRMLQNAALWRRRVLMMTTAAAGAVAATTTTEDGLHEVDAEDNKLYAASTSSSEGEATMPGLPNVASITNVPAAEDRATTSPMASAMPVAATASAAAGPASPPLRVYTRSTRAEQLIFDKAVDCIQSEALAVLLSAPAPPPPHHGNTAGEGRRRTSEAGGSGGAHQRNHNDLFDVTDDLEEEEEAARMRRGQAAKLPLFSPSSASTSYPRLSSTTAGVDVRTKTATTATHDAMPPHRGIALLRVLLQHAVLSAAEVGLEPEDLFAARSSPLGPAAAAVVPHVFYPHGDSGSGLSKSPARASPFTATAVPSSAVSSLFEGADAEASGYAFVVQVPVYATLQPSDAQVVERLLSAAARVFASLQLTV